MSAPEYFEEPLVASEIQRLRDEEFGDMVKFVVDLERRVICAGGGFHSDEEEILLQKGSKQPNLWGENFYPDRPLADKLVFTSQINIRPRDGNTKQEIQSSDLREKVSELAKYFFGTV